MILYDITVHLSVHIAEGGGNFPPTRMRQAATEAPLHTLTIASRKSGTQASKKRAMPQGWQKHFEVCHTQPELEIQPGPWLLTVEP